MIGFWPFHACLFSFVAANNGPAKVQCIVDIYCSCYFMMERYGRGRVQKVQIADRMATRNSWVQERIRLYRYGLTRSTVYEVSITHFNNTSFRSVGYILLNTNNTNCSCQILSIICATKLSHLLCCTCKECHFSSKI
jgi:hypothetical protein